MLLRAVFCALVGTASMPGALADTTYPQRAVRIIVPFAPGGGTDLIARVVAAALQKELKQPFVVENKAGAAGNIGTDLVAAAAPDGYTLVATQSGIAINETLMPAARTRVLKDLSPIALLGSSPVVIGSSAAVPAGNMRELLAYLRANPNKVSFTSCGVGTPQHIAGELLNSAAGTKMRHVPYKG